jgi:hypothetical protein
VKSGTENGQMMPFSSRRFRQNRYGESQDRDGWVMLKMMGIKRVLVAGEKQLGIKTPEN